MARAARSWLLAGLALAYLICMFLAGELPRHGHYHQSRGPEGLLAATPAAVVAVTLETPTLAVKLVRRPSGWAHATGLPLAAAAAEALEQALAYTHRAPPVRALTGRQDEAKLSRMGLRPPRLLISAEVEGESVFRLGLGDTNADGVLRYARHGDAETVLLLSGFLGEAWLELAATLMPDQAAPEGSRKRGDAALQSGITGP